MKRIIVIALLLCACNRQYRLPKEVYIESIFQPYVSEFVSDSEVVGRPIVIDDLIVEFISGLGGSILGECQDGNRGKTGTPNIYINSDNWDSLQSTQKKALIFHELGHCVLFLGHDETMINIDGYLIPKSLMYPYIQSDNIYVDHWNSYVTELFTGVWQ